MYCFFIPMPLMAEAESANKTTPPTLNELDIFQVITPLLMVIILIFILAWLVKKINTGIPAMGKDIEILSTTPLSGQSRLCLVRVAGKDMLLGVTATHITHIQTFDEPLVEAGQKDRPKTLSKKSQIEFAEQFKKLLTKKDRQ